MGTGGGLVEPQVPLDSKLNVYVVPSGMSAVASIEKVASMMGVPGPPFEIVCFTGVQPAAGQTLLDRLRPAASPVMVARKKFPAFAIDGSESLSDWAEVVVFPDQ